MARLNGFSCSVTHLAFEVNLVIGDFQITNSNFRDHSIISSEQDTNLAPLSRPRRYQLKGIGKRLVHGMGKIFNRPQDASLPEKRQRAAQNGSNERPKKRFKSIRGKHVVAAVRRRYEFQ